MNKITKIAAGIALASCATISTSAFAEVSYNIGYASEYIFRGVSQKTSSASAGIDFEMDGFYAGGWTADVGDGLEVDALFGYGMNFGDVSASIGFTGYFYTGDFDDTYKEINLNVGYDIFSAELSFGEYDNFGGPSLDYAFTAVSVEKNGFHGTVGAFFEDFDGEYIEVGYGFTAADIDFGIAGIISSKELAGGDSDQSLVFTIGKSF